MATGKFRPDLAFRFGAALIRIPPLRDRREDIPLLATHFAERVSGESLRIAPEAMRILMGYSWPGNVRELRHVVELASTLSAEVCLSADAVKAALRHRSPAVEESATRPVEGSTESEEQRALVQCLERHGWNVPSAARELGVTKKTVYARIQRFGLRIPSRYHRRLPPPPPSSPIELRAL